MLENVGGCIAFFVEVQFYKDGKRCVPVHYSDNFVFLLPGETVTIEVADRPEDAVPMLKGWNLMELRHK